MLIKYDIIHTLFRWLKDVSSPMHVAEIFWKSTTTSQLMVRNQRQRSSSKFVNTITIVELQLNCLREYKTNQLFIMRHF